MEQQPALYDGLVGRLGAGKLGAWRHQLFASLSGDILELGIGTGLNLSAYNPDAQVIGVDVERVLMERARCRGAQTIVGDGERLPFPDARFDYVTSALVFCSIPDPAQALREAARVLRPGGRLLQLEHTCSDHALPDMLLDLITPLWATIAGGCHPNRDTPTLLERCGWRLLRHERRLGGLIRLLEALPPARD